MDERAWCYKCFDFLVAIKLHDWPFTARSSDFAISGHS